MRPSRPEQTVRHHLSVLAARNARVAGRLGARCPASIRRAGSIPTAKACCSSPTTARCRRASPSRVTNLSNAIGRRWKAQSTRCHLKKLARGVDLGDYVTRPCRAEYVEPTDYALDTHAADPLSRRDSDHMDRVVDHRRQEPPGASHDRRGRFPDIASRARRHRRTRYFLARAATGRERRIAAEGAHGKASPERICMRA